MMLYFGFEHGTEIEMCLFACVSCLRLLLHAILQSKDGVVVAFGLVCSTFITISRGSTHRHYFLPLGDQDAKSVAASNILAARTHHCNIQWFMFVCYLLYSIEIFPCEDLLSNAVGDGKGWGLGFGTTQHYSLAYRLRGFQEILRKTTAPHLHQ